ncbi:protein EMSY-LIKE 3 isoform X1 [Canna indica]|uniref:Protein EMSY-LIKE 3 isoform X1 n=1 Tax=Canna indica TaxID=4628 RepID=A0AAQ3K0W0_9LILI|nr:protein EMSY-LIKE 3 isoform X1 [Canna indica]
MEYDPSDSSGTDDDLPPSHHNRGTRPGRVNGNGRATVGVIPFTRVPNDMEDQIHRLEQEAYSSVLRAFKAQSDAITWEKESLITELRKELRVSDEEHRELLSRVNADDIIQRIREWRQKGIPQTGIFNNAQPDIAAPNPTASESRKRLKTSQIILSLTPAMHTQVAAPMQPYPSIAKRGASAGIKGKKPQSGGTFSGTSSVKSMQFHSAGPSGRDLVVTRNFSGPLAAGEHSEPALFDPLTLIGRKVMTRWPEDNNFYEAVIKDYDPARGTHALVYDIGTNSETWEWVNLKEICPEDIRWVGERPGIAHQSSQGALVNGIKRSTVHGAVIPGAGRGRGSLKIQMKDFPPSQNGSGKKFAGDVELQTDNLIMEVEKLLSATHPDPLEIEKAKKMLKEHEQILLDAITRLPDPSDGERAFCYAEEARHQSLHGQSMDVDEGWRDQQLVRNQYGANYDDAMAVDGGEAFEGDQMVAGEVAADHWHNGGDHNDL